VSSTDWPAPIELQRLSGHRNEIVQAEFSSSGAMLATASLDGSVRVSVCRCLCNYLSEGVGFGGLVASRVV
jgi:WD40 repeat protein